jgi:hypothetical protein
MSVTSSSNLSNGGMVRAGLISLEWLIVARCIVNEHLIAVQVDSAYFHATIDTARGPRSLRCG